MPRPISGKKSGQLKANYVFLGISEQGLLNVQANNKKLAISGKLFHVDKFSSPIPKAETFCSPRYKQSSTAKSGYFKGPDGIVFIQGDVVRDEATSLVPAEIKCDLALPSLQVASVVDSFDVVDAHSEVKAPFSTKKKKPYGYDQVAYEIQLAKISAEKRAGMDSYVRLDFILIYVGECRANIYRKIKNGDFPKPIKRAGGKGSYWLISEIDKYKAGKTNT